MDINEDKKSKKKRIIGIACIILSVITFIVAVYCWQSINIAFVIQTDSSQKINVSTNDYNEEYDAIEISCIDTILYRFSDDDNNTINVGGVNYELAPNTPIVHHGLRLDNRYKLVSNKELSYTNIEFAYLDGVTSIDSINYDYLNDNIVKSKKIIDLTTIVVDSNTVLVLSNIKFNDEYVGIGLYDISNNTYVSLENEYILNEEDYIYIGEIKLSMNNFNQIMTDLINGTLVIGEQPTDTDNDNDGLYEDNSNSNNNTNNNNSNSETNDSSNVNNSDSNNVSDSNNGGKDTANNDTNSDNTNNGSGSDSNTGTTPPTDTQNGNGNGETPPPVLVKPVITNFTVTQINETDTIKLDWTIQENDYPISTIDIYIDGVKLGTVDGSSTSYETVTTYYQHSVKIVANYEGGSVSSETLFVDVNGSLIIDSIGASSDSESVTISGIGITGPVLDQVSAITIELIGENGETYTYDLSPEEVELIKSGESINVVIPGLESDTKWTINIFTYDEKGQLIPVTQKDGNYIYTDVIVPTIEGTLVTLDYYNQDEIATSTISFINPDNVLITISDNYGTLPISSDNNITYTTTFNVGSIPGDNTYEITSATYIKNRGTNELGNIEMTQNKDMFTVMKETPYLDESLLQGLEVTPNENEVDMTLTYTDKDLSIYEMSYTLYDNNQQVVPGYEKVLISNYTPENTTTNIPGLISGQQYYVSINVLYDDYNPTNGSEELNLIDMQPFTTLDGTQLNYVSSAVTAPIETTSGQLNTIEFSGNAIPFIETADVIITEANQIFNPETHVYAMNQTQIDDIKSDNVLTSFIVDGLTPATEYEVSFKFITYDGYEIIIDANETGMSFTTDNVEPVVVSHTITDGTTENGIYMENTPLTGTITFDNPVETVTLSNGIVPTTTDGITWTYTTSAMSPSMTNIVKIDSFTYIENSTGSNTLTVDSLLNSNDDTVYTTQKVVPTYNIVAWDNNIDDNFTTLSFTANINDIDNASSNLDLNLYNVSDSNYATGELVDPLDNCPITGSTVNCNTTVPLDTGAEYEVRLEGTYNTYNPADIAPTPLASLNLTVSTYDALEILSYDTTSTEDSIEFNNITYTIQDNMYINTLTAEIKDDTNTVIDTKTYASSDVDNTVINDINAGNPFTLLFEGLNSNNQYTVTISTIFNDGKTQISTGMNPLTGYTNSVIPTISSVEVTNGYVNDSENGEFVVSINNPSNTRLESITYTNTGGTSGTCDFTNAFYDGTTSTATCAFTANDIAQIDAEIKITEITYYINDDAVTPTTVTTNSSALYNVTKDMPTMEEMDFTSIVSSEMSNNNVDMFVEFKYLDEDLAASNIRVAIYEDLNGDGIADNATPVTMTSAIAQNDTAQTVTLNGLEAGTNYVISVLADIDTYNPSELVNDYVLASISYETIAGQYIEITGGELSYTDEAGALLPNDTLLLQNMTLSGSGLENIITVTGGTITINGVVIPLTSEILTDLSDGTQDTPILITGLVADTLQTVTFDLPDFIIDSSSITIQNYTNKNNLILDNITLDSLNGNYSKGMSGVATLNITDTNATPTMITSITSAGTTFDINSLTGEFIAAGEIGTPGGPGTYTINVSEICIDANQDEGEQLSCNVEDKSVNYTVIAENPSLTVEVIDITDTTATMNIDITDIDMVMQDIEVTVTDQLGNYAQLSGGEILNGYSITGDTSLSLVNLNPGETYDYIITYNADILDGQGLQPSEYTGSFVTDYSAPNVFTHTITNGTVPNGIYNQGEILTGTIIFNSPVEEVILSDGIVPTTTDGITWTYTTSAMSPSMTNTVSIESFTYIESPTTTNTLTVDSSANTSDDTFYVTQKVVPTYDIVAWNNNNDNDNFTTLSFTVNINDIDSASENLNLNLYNVSDSNYAAGELVDPLDNCPITGSTVNCTTTAPLDTGAEYEVRLEGTYDTYNPADIAPTPLASLNLTVSTYEALEIVSYDTTSTDTTITFENITYTIQDNAYIETLTAEVKDSTDTIVGTKTYTSSDVDNTVITDINTGLPFALTITGLNPNEPYTVHITTTFADGKTQVATGMNPLNGHTNAVTPTIESIEVINGFVNDGESGDFIVTFNNPSDTRLKSLNYTNSGGGASGCMLTSATDSGNQTIATCPFNTNDVPMQDAIITATDFTYYENDMSTTTVTIPANATGYYDITKDMPTMVLTDFISVTSTEVNNGEFNISVEFKYSDEDLAATNIRVNAYEDLNNDNIPDNPGTPEATISASAIDNTPQTVTLTGLLGDTNYVIDVIADIDTYNPAETQLDYKLGTTTYKTPVGKYISITGGQLSYVDESGTLLPSDTMMLQNLTLTGSGVSSLDESIGATININGSSGLLPQEFLVDISDGTQDTPILITGLVNDTMQEVTFAFPGYEFSQNVTIENYTNKSPLIFNSLKFDNSDNVYAKGEAGVATIDVTDNNFTPTYVGVIDSTGLTFNSSTYTSNFTASSTTTGVYPVTVTGYCMDGNASAGEQLYCEEINVLSSEYYVSATAPTIGVDVTNITTDTATVTTQIDDIDNTIIDATITILDELGNPATLSTGEDVVNYPVTDNTVLNLGNLIPDTEYVATVTYSMDLLDNQGVVTDTYVQSFRTLKIPAVVTISGPTSVDFGTSGNMYTATVTGTGITDESVTWSLSGSNSATSGTVITPAGELIIASDEMADEITLTATSVQDPTASSTYIVDIKAVITSITINGPSSRLAGSQLVPYSAVVTGEGSYDTGVTWSVEGSSNPNTYINANGELFIAPDEQSSSITIIATSVEDPTKTGEKVVTITSMVQDITVDGPTSVSPGNTAQYTALVTGVGVISQDVMWEVTNNTDPTTTIDASTGLLEVGTNETATSLNIEATSYQDGSISNIMTVTMDYDAVTGVIVSGPGELSPGEQGVYYADVSGEGTFDSNVTWSITGQQSGGTTINENGELDIAPDETSTSITVFATSVEDPSQVGEKTVLITPAKSQKDKKITMNIDKISLTELIYSFIS